MRASEDKRHESALARSLGSYVLSMTAVLLGLFLSLTAQAALNESCVVSVLNRTVQVKADGSWVLPNIPANMGPVRARATCVQNGITTSGESAYFTIPANGSLDIPPVVIGPVTPIPTAVKVTAATTRLTQPGQTVQLNVTATYADGTSKPVNTASADTKYIISNPALAAISPNGLITALASGTVIVQAVNEGTQGLLQLNIALSADTDGDGIPDDVEQRLGLDPNNPADALDDPDHDSLTNLQEYQHGTDLAKTDTDGDGLTDGDEINGTAGFFTNPLLADTDGDNVPDNIEIASGSDPTNAASINLAMALKAITVTPATALINVNSIVGLGFADFKVTGEFALGGTIDLTAPARGTNYSSSNLQICNFGADNGRVYGGSNGTCTITITNGGHSTTAQVTVNFFVPTALSYIDIPGYANNVDVAGNYAYVAAGSTGLKIVDVTDRRLPRIVGTLDTPGNANDVRVLGNLAYVADGSAGLQIIDITVPTAPVLRGTYNTAGDALDVALSGTRAYVADGAFGLQIIDIANPLAPALLGTYNTVGTAKGVDINGNLAIVADGTSGIQVIDVTNPALPVRVGGLATVNAQDITVESNIAYVADDTGSLKVIDLSTPASPRLTATTTGVLGGYLMDVAKAGHFVFGSDVYFVNGVPIVDVTDPSNLLVRARLDFPARDDNGTGIAVDGQYIYLTAAWGTLGKGASGNTRLYIGQYLIAEDKAGVSPTVSLASPQNNEVVLEGAQIPITVNATDDVQVVAANLLVNGQIVSTDTSPPYQFSYLVPTNISGLTLSANATDLGGNIGSASDTFVSVIPDPLTTVVGSTIDTNGNPISGALVTATGGQTINSALDGTFSIPNVPTVFGNVQVNAEATVNGIRIAGGSFPTQAVRAGTTSVGNVRLSSLQELIPILTSPTSASTVGFVSASSSYTGPSHGLHKAMDGDLVTGWSTTTIGLGEWLKWTFIKPTAVEEFQYTTWNYLHNLLEYSDDDLNWFSASAVYPEGAGSFVHPTTTGSTPHYYWRLKVNQVYGPTVANWYGYTRFQLYGNPMPVETPPPVVASGWYLTDIPARAVDKSLNTGWNSAGFAPQWIYVDLGSKRPISEVRVLAGAGYPAGVTYYNIQVSDDAVTWVTIANASSSAAWGITKVSANARYVRLYITSHSGGSWNTIQEFQVY